MGVAKWQQSGKGFVNEDETRVSASTGAIYFQEKVRRYKLR